MGRAVVYGFVVGFPIAASPGPMFFLVLRRTLARGWRRGLISGLGIATGDGIYAAIAAFGMGALITIMVGQRRWIGLAGGIAIALIGIRMIANRDPQPASPHKGEGDVASYASTLGLTLSNPPTILSFIAVFAGLAVHVGTGWQPAAGLVLGVTFGSALWWALLTALVALMRTRLSPRVTRAVGVVAGLALILSGALISLQAL